MMHRGTHPGEHQGIGLNGTIFLSLLVHLCLLSLLVIPRSLSTPKWTFGPLYSVQLVSMPSELTNRRETDLSYKELMENKSSGQAVLKKESIDNLPSAPIYSLKVSSKPAAGMDNVMEAIRKKIQSAPQAPPLEKAQKDTERTAPQATSSQTASTQAKPNEEEMNAKMRNYYGLIWSRIKGMWALPRGILPQENMEVVVHTRILRDGTIVDIGFEKRSGNRYFDESALRAVKKASPVHPLPDGVSDNSIEVGIRFHSSEFR